MLNIPMNIVGSLTSSQLSSDAFARKSNGYDVSAILRGITSPQGYVQQPNQMPQQGFGNQMPQQGFGNQMPQQGFGNQMPQQGFSQQSTVQQGFGGQPQMAAQHRQRNFGNGVILRKGQKTSLEQLCPGLDLIQVGLGWDLGPNGQGYDLDVDAFMLGADGRVVGDDWFVFYNQPESPDQSVRLLCDSTTGAGSGDDEIVQVQLSKVNPQVQKIVFIVSINEAKQYGYNFSNVANAYVRITDVKTSNEIARFQLTDYYANVNSMVVGEVYRHNGQWKFNPVGDGVSADLMDLCIRYGVNVGG